MFRQMQFIFVFVLAITSAPLVQAQTSRWSERTNDWSANPLPKIGDWGFDRPGYPSGLYIHGVTVAENEPVLNPIIYDNDVFDDVFDDELLLAMASLKKANLVGLIVTPVLTDGWGFSKPEWKQTAYDVRSLAQNSGLKMDRIPPITIGTEADSERAGIEKDSPGARLYIKQIQEQFQRDPSKPLLISIGGQGATLASAYALDPTIADRCIVYYTDIRVYNGNYTWASELIAKHFRVVSWGDDNWWITKKGQNEWRVLPRPIHAEGSENADNSGEWKQFKDLKKPILDDMVRQFQTRHEYCKGDKKGDAYADGTFLHAWLPGIFEDAAITDIRNGKVLHVTKFTSRNEDLVKAFATSILLDPFAYVSRKETLGPLQVNPNGHTLQTQDGRPFFWLGDTAWELVHRLNRKDTLAYLEARAKQGFNVIQTVAIAEFDGLNTSNANGHRPLIENDPMRPDVRDGEDNDFWDDLDFVIESARQRELRVALLPTWGEWVTPRFSKPGIFLTAQQGYTYGHFLGERYRKYKNLVWVLGGDRPADEAPHGMAVWKAMAEGLADGTNGINKQDNQADWSTTLISYHSMTSCSKWFPNEPWLDFYMWGTYHSPKDWRRSIDVATKDYGLSPAKPTLNAEPPYEEHPKDYDPKNGFFDEHEIRSAAWWSVMSGAMGHTYGAHPIWQFYNGKPNPKSKVPVPDVSAPRMTWNEAMNLPVANQLKHLRALFASVDFDSYQPNNNWFRYPPKTTSETEMTKNALAGGIGNKFAFVYIPMGETVEVMLEQLPFEQPEASWFNPRSGEVLPITSIKNKQNQTYDPPNSPSVGNDWVLVFHQQTK
jgi:hypothetical protein